MCQLSANSLCCCSAHYCIHPSILMWPHKQDTGLAGPSSWSLNQNSLMFQNSGSIEISSSYAIFSFFFLFFLFFFCSPLLVPFLYLVSWKLHENPFTINTRFSNYAAECLSLSTLGFICFLYESECHLKWVQMY